MALVLVLFDLGNMSTVKYCYETIIFRFVTVSRTERTCLPSTRDKLRLDKVLGCIHLIRYLMYLNFLILLFYYVVGLCIQEVIPIYLGIIGLCFGFAQVQAVQII